MKPIFVALLAFGIVAPGHAARISLSEKNTVTALASSLSEREYRERAIPLTKQAVWLSSRIVLESSDYQLRVSFWTMLSQMSPAQRAALDISNYNPAGATIRHLHRTLLNDMLELEQVSTRLTALTAPFPLSDVRSSLGRFQQQLTPSLRLMRRGLGTRSPELLQEGETALQGASGDLLAAYDALSSKHQFLIDKNASVPV